MNEDETREECDSDEEACAKCEGEKRKVESNESDESDESNESDESDESDNNRSDDNNNNDDIDKMIRGYKRSADEK